MKRFKEYLAEITIDSVKKWHKDTKRGNKESKAKITKMLKDTSLSGKQKMKKEYAMVGQQIKKNLAILKKALLATKDPKKKAELKKNTKTQNDKLTLKIKG